MIQSFEEAVQANPATCRATAHMARGARLCEAGLQTSPAAIFFRFNPDGSCIAKEILQFFGQPVMLNELRGRFELSRGEWWQAVATLAVGLACFAVAWYAYAVYAASAEEEGPGARPLAPDGPADRAPLPTCSVPAPADSRPSARDWRGLRARLCQRPHCCF